MTVLVDSSIWIQAANPKKPECLQLKRLISEKYPIYYADPIQMEVAQGSKTLSMFKKVWDSFLGFQKLIIDDRIWESASWNYLRCRKKGITISSMDAIIATLSIENRIPLWSADKDFQGVRKVTGLDLFQI